MRAREGKGEVSIRSSFKRPGPPRKTFAFRTLVSARATFLSVHRPDLSRISSSPTPLACLPLASSSGRPHPSLPSDQQPLP